MKIGVQTLTVHTKRPFTIARGSSDAFERVVLTLEEDPDGGHEEALGLGKLVIDQPQECLFMSVESATQTEFWTAHVHVQEGKRVISEWNKARVEEAEGPFVGVLVPNGPVN